jgi:hypothetical protein
VAAAATLHAVDGAHVALWQPRAHRVLLLESLLPAPVVSSPYDVSWMRLPIVLVVMIGAAFWHMSRRRREETRGEADGLLRSLMARAPPSSFDATARGGAAAPPKAEVDRIIAHFRAEEAREEAARMRARVQRMYGTSSAAQPVGLRTDAAPRGAVDVDGVGEGEGGWASAGVDDDDDDGGDFGAGAQVHGDSLADYETDSG